MCRCRVKVGTLVFVFVTCLFLRNCTLEIITISKQIGRDVGQSRAAAGVRKMEEMRSEFDCLYESVRSGLNSARLPLQ